MVSDGRYSTNWDTATISAACLWLPYTRLSNKFRTCRRYWLACSDYKSAHLVIPASSSHNATLWNTCLGSPGKRAALAKGSSPAVRKAGSKLLGLLADCVNASTAAPLLEEPRWWAVLSHALYCTPQVPPCSAPHIKKIAHFVQFSSLS